MSRTIYKYQLSPWGETVLYLPPDAVVLTAQAQKNQIQLWVEVPDRPAVSRRFVVHLTGVTIYTRPWPERERYIATVQMDDFVFHVYEVTKE